MKKLSKTDLLCIEVSLFQLKDLLSLAKKIGPYGPIRPSKITKDEQRAFKAGIESVEDLILEKVIDMEESIRTGYYTPSTSARR